MFNGIIFNKGIVYKILKKKDGIDLFLKSKLKLKKKDIGVSVACDGVCLTLISCKSNILEFYLSKETISRTKFKNLKIDDEINLELPLKKGNYISKLSIKEAQDLIDNETITGGMIPKIETCISAVKNGVGGVVIIDGTRPHAVLHELFTNEGAGTLIVE